MTLFALFKKIFLILGKELKEELIVQFYPYIRVLNKMVGNDHFIKNGIMDHDWLEYSPSLDLAFCFPCRAFKGNELNSSRTDETFSNNGFKGWYRAKKVF